MKIALVNAIIRPRMIWLVSLIFILALGIRLWGLNAVGNVWDEYFYYDASRDFMRNVTNHDFNPEHWNSNKEHPPIGKYIYAPAMVWNKLVHVSDRDAYHAPRVISAVLGSITVVLVFLIGAEFFSTGVGVMAALFFGFIPTALAYHKIINLDVTMVLFFTAAMYGLFRWLKTESVRPLWWSIFFASLAFATKFNGGLIILVYLGTLMIKQWRQVKKTGLLSLPLPLIFLVPAMVVTLVAVWPWLWGNSLDHFLQTLLHWGGGINELFLGTVQPTPRTYFLIHFLFEIPFVTLLLFFLGLWWVIKNKRLTEWVLVLWVLAPFATSFYHIRQDNLRYVQAAFPALALIAALGFWHAARIIQHGRRELGVLVGILIPFGISIYRLAQHQSLTVAIIYSGILLAGLVGFWHGASRLHLLRHMVPIFAAVTVAAYLIILAIVFHPYYLNYFNILIGGPQYVSRHHLFNIGYYGDGIKEATEYVNKVAPAGARVRFEIIPDDAPYLDRPRLVRYDFDGADYLIVNSNLYNDPDKTAVVQAILPAYNEIYSIKANGAPFVWIYKIIK